MTELHEAPPGASDAPCEVCGRPTIGRVVVGDGFAPVCHKCWRARHGARVKALRDEVERLTELAERTAALRAEIERLRGASMCDACAGTGKPVSGGACMCGGTGFATDAVCYLRGKVERLRADNALRLEREQLAYDSRNAAQARCNEMSAEVERLRALHIATADALHRDLAAAIARAEAAWSERAEAWATREEERAARESAARERDTSREMLAEAVGNEGAALARIEVLTRERDEARSDREAARDRFKAAADEAGMAKRDLAAARELLETAPIGGTDAEVIAWIDARALLGKEGALYPCAKCGKARTRAEGGTTFTVCDACWDGER